MGKNCCGCKNDKDEHLEEDDEDKEDHDYFDEDGY